MNQATVLLAVEQFLHYLSEHTGRWIDEQFGHGNPEITISRTSSSEPARMSTRSKQFNENAGQQAG